MKRGFHEARKSLLLTLKGSPPRACRPRGNGRVCCHQNPPVHPDEARDPFLRGADPSPQWLGMTATGPSIQQRPAADVLVQRWQPRSGRRGFVSHSGQHVFCAVRQNPPFSATSSWNGRHLVVGPCWDPRMQQAKTLPTRQGPCISSLPSAASVPRANRRTTVRPSKRSFPRSCL